MESQYGHWLVTETGVQTGWLVVTAGDGNVSMGAGTSPANKCVIRDTSTQLELE